MTQSPELGGGEGFTYEGDVAAFYLSALLAEKHAPGINERIVVGVSVQQRDLGEPLDDVIVDFADTEGDRARLSLQVKRSLTISAAKTNEDFYKIVRDSWKTFQKPDFRLGIDRYGAAAGTIAAGKKRHLCMLCDWARESPDTDHFQARFAAKSIASKKIRKVMEAVTILLEKVREQASSPEEIHSFLAHFVLIQFDFLREGSTDPSEAINGIRDSLAPSQSAKAPLIWAKLVQLARASAGTAGQYDRARLVRELSSTTRLRGASSLRPDLDRLTELARNYAKLVPDDIGGTKLDRASLFEDLNAKLTNARFVQVRGLPGCGKSVLIRRAVEDCLEQGPVLFLKADQLEGTSWISYSASQGLTSGVALEHLLVEIGATGTPTFFVDAIDRVARKQQPIIYDVIRSIVESPRLDNWRIAASLRDTGIAALRNWLGDLLDSLKVATVSVERLDDVAAEMLAKANPKMKSLLFGPAEVREIVRRPFFAKVLDQGQLGSGSSDFIPQSEVDLIENWWARGGYNETGQNVIERQRVLLNLAREQARRPGMPIGLSRLDSVIHIDSLRSDGIIQDVRAGVSVRFAHDIFFEWAFFYVLADRGPKWVQEIRACGEPPAIARVVELTSQWEYSQGKNWTIYLAQTEGAGLRSQWQRAWLLGPFASAKFEANEDQFTTAVFADDFRLLKKALVWFQAEKTSPNERILAGSLPLEERQRYADHFGWPSDFDAWRRFINFLLARISDIPDRYYSSIIAVFEVWQNALAGVRNPTSKALLQQCRSWLNAIDRGHGKRTDDSSKYRGKDRISNLGRLRTSVIRLLLTSSRAEPAFAAEYLKQIVASEAINEDEFQQIVAFSPILAQTLSDLLVELSLTALRAELPAERVTRRRQEISAWNEQHEAVLAKPESERTDQEKMSISLTKPPFRGFSERDWQQLSVHNDLRNYWPASPLREPFHSLFQRAPDQALRLLRELCNHATTAWRQLHQYNRDEQMETPIPLELEFPWGSQQFWGGDREYLWCRSIQAPRVIGCGFMALEEWCFAELRRGQPIDELIRQIIEGNECVAALGVASMLTLHTKTVSEVTLLLITSQRLLDADFKRMFRDSISAPNLRAFDQQDEHYEAVKAANDRAVRRMNLRLMIPVFVLGIGSIRNQAIERIRSFKSDLPFQYEEHRGVREIQEELMDSALRYEEMVNPNNYKVDEYDGDQKSLRLIHVSPLASKPENIARAEDASKRLTEESLWVWASRSFKEKSLDTAHSIEDAIDLAKELDTGDLFQSVEEELLLETRRGAVAAAAAVSLSFRTETDEEDLEWARDVLTRAADFRTQSDLALPGSNISWHPAIFAARGISADLREDTARQGSAEVLLGLVSHPLDAVSLAATEEACGFWTQDSKLTWAALIIAFSCCRQVSRQYWLPQAGAAQDLLAETQAAAVLRAVENYQSKDGWPSLPLPPPAWMRTEPSRALIPSFNEHTEDRLLDDGSVWSEPEISWYSERAAAVLGRIPLEEIMLSDDVRDEFLRFLTGLLDWTKQRIAPAWAEMNPHVNRETTHLLGWIRALGLTLGQVAGHLSLEETRKLFLEPIFELEGEDCWTLLQPFTSIYVSSYLYDATDIPEDLLPTLDLCIDRFLESLEADRDNDNGYGFSDLNRSRLTRVLMFVSVEKAELAARFANGNWSEIELILPFVDRFIRAGRWHPSVVDAYLTLCERSKDDFPAEMFADQVLEILEIERFQHYQNERRRLFPARIAELVHYFAHRNAPMALDLAQKFLRILDHLVDLGDRRSAALQLGESFRDVRLPSSF